jgi:hypothetical protein
LVILSLQHILDLAVTELIAIGEQMLKPFKRDGAWSSHGIELDNVLARYSSSLEVLRGKLKSAPSAIAHIVLSATMDIVYSARFLDNSNVLEEQTYNILRYEEQSHHGIAYILQMRRLQYDTNPTEHDVQDLINTRNKLIDSISGVIERQHLEELLVDLTQTQLFVPRDLFKIPAISKAIKQDGRRDCLWRPVGHVLHDNKVEAKFRLNFHEDGYDVLGRSRLHIACALGADEQHVPDLLTIPKSEWSFAKALGLNAFHIAAIHGNTYIFKAAAVSGFGFVQSAHMRLSSYTGRNYFHWAACLGHLELVEYFLRLREGKPNLALDLLACRDRWNDTAMHLATRNGHTYIVKVILSHTDWAAMALPFQHTPF